MASLSSERKMIKILASSCLESNKANRHLQGQMNASSAVPHINIALERPQRAFCDGA